MVSTYCNIINISIYMNIYQYIWIYIYQYIWIYINIYQYISIYLYIYINIYQYISIYINIYQYISIYINIYQYISIYINIYISIYINIYISIYINIYIYQYIYIYINIYQYISIYINIYQYISIYINIYQYISIYIYIYQYIYISIYISKYINNYTNISNNTWTCVVSWFSDHAGRLFQEHPLEPRSADFGADRWWHETRSDGLQHWHQRLPRSVVAGILSAFLAQTDWTWPNCGDLWWDPESMLEIWGRQARSDKINKTVDNGKFGRFSHSYGQKGIQLSTNLGGFRLFGFFFGVALSSGKEQIPELNGGLSSWKIIELNGVFSSKLWYINCQRV